jgi:hypothetical protein
MSVIPTKIMCSYICNNIDDLNFQNRKDVLQVIYNSPSKKKITEKGNGSQIKMDDLPEVLIRTIYDFINQKLKAQTTEFNLEI